jgi:hypothetical protein
MRLDPHARARLERLGQLIGQDERLDRFAEAFDAAKLRTGDELALVLVDGAGAEAARFYLPRTYWPGLELLLGVVAAESAAERCRIHDEAIRAADRQPEGGAV